MSHEARLAEVFDALPLTLKTTNAVYTVHEMESLWLIEFLQRATKYINEIWPDKKPGEETKEASPTDESFIAKATALILGVQELTDLLLTHSMRDGEGKALTSEGVLQLKPRALVKAIELALVQNISQELIDSVKGIGAQFIVMMMPLRAPQKKSAPSSRS